MTQPRFALIGAAGFVAPRHMQAIQHVGGKLVACLDPHDAVGILDRFDKTTEFFTDEYRFERWLEKQRLDGTQVDWLVVCSPNYMHDRHIRMGLWAGAKVLCEKPLVVNPDNLDRIAEMEDSFKKHTADRQVFTVLQLRHAEKLRTLRVHWQKEPPKQARLFYATPRGKWYFRSWKGDIHKSGGLITNIGIHMFDFLIWTFGACCAAQVVERTAPWVRGHGIFGQTKVVWDLSIEDTDSGSAERWIEVNGARTDFAGFENLHNVVYEETLAGRGHGIEDARPALELVAKLR